MADRKRVLVVEDNEINMLLTRDVLRLAGHDVLEATDGETAVRVAHEEKPDLILMDLALPGVDGWTAARLLKDDPETRAIPVIAVTAYAMKGDRERALAAGCDEYLSKPIKVAELVRLVALFLSKKAE
jgi:CheY-like chemotaxis protein